MKTPINMKTIREHWHYSWWKYFFIVVFAFVTWSLFYTMTAYRPPEEKQVEMFIMGYGDYDTLDNYMKGIQTEEMPDMEQMSGVFLTYDEQYSSMQLMTYFAAGEGDLYVLPKDFFQTYASDGAFVALEDLPGLTDKLESAGIDLGKGWRTNIETKEKHLYGIPLQQLPGIDSLLYTAEDLYLSIMVNNGNFENVAKFLDIFIDDMLEDRGPAPAPAA